MMAVEAAPQKRQNQESTPFSGRRWALLDTLWRLGAWGLAAALSVAAVTVIVQTDRGSERMQSLLNGTAEAITAPAAVAPLPSRAAEFESATRALDAQVRELSADRDRLVARLASLERHLEDMTGSIQPAMQLPSPAVPAPAASPPAVTLAAAPPAPKIAAPPPSPAVHIINPLAATPSSEGAATWPETAKPQEAADDERLPPLPAAREVASLPNPSETAQSIATDVKPLPAMARTEYGIELATGPTVDLLRTHWAAVKANYGPLLTGLQPVAVRDRRPGGTGYRLVAGPMPSFTAAKQVCARLTQAHMACHPAKFDGQAIVQR
jgi:SPOR domain